MKVKVWFEAYTELEVDEKYDVLDKEEDYNECEEELFDELQKEVRRIVNNKLSSLDIKAYCFDNCESEKGTAIWEY